jgi:hypothetical protein
MWQVQSAEADCWPGALEALDLAVRSLQGAEMKQTQYAKILAALRKAGRNGCTIRDLLPICNWPHKRICEMETAWIWNGDDKERIVRDSKQVNGRSVRVYRLERA